MELKRQFPLALTLSGVPILNPRLWMYMTLTVSIGLESRNGMCLALRKKVAAGIPGEQHTSEKRDLSLQLKK